MHDFEQLGQLFDIDNSVSTRCYCNAKLDFTGGDRYPWHGHLIEKPSPLKHKDIQQYAEYQAHIFRGRFLKGPRGHQKQKGPPSSITVGKYPNIFEASSTTPAAAGHSGDAEDRLKNTDPFSAARISLHLHQS